MNFETHFMSHLEFSFQFRTSYIEPQSQPVQAKPYHTKPRHFMPIFWPFDPFLGQNNQKTTVTKLSEHSPLIYSYGQNIFW